MQYDHDPDPKSGWILLAVGFPLAMLGVWAFFSAIAPKPHMGEHYPYEVAGAENPPPEATR